MKKLVKLVKPQVCMGKLVRPQVHGSSTPLTEIFFLCLSTSYKYQKFLKQSGPLSALLSKENALKI